jgi:hypothetical protein
VNKLEEMAAKEILRRPLTIVGSSRWRIMSTTWSFSSARNAWTLKPSPSPVETRSSGALLDADDDGLYAGAREVARRLQAEDRFSGAAASND